MDVLFSGRQGYIKERSKSSLRKFYCRYGDLIKQYKVVLSQILHDILDDGHMDWHPPMIRHYTILWPRYWTGPYMQNFYVYQIAIGFYRTFATDVACLLWRFTPLDTLSISHFGVAYVLLLKTISLISPELVFFGLFNFEHPWVL